MADPRTQAPPLPGLEGPQVQGVTPASVVGGQAQAPSTGFDLMRQGLNSFFGQSEQGVDAVDKAVQQAQITGIRTQYYLRAAEAQRGNKENMEAAQASALAGRPMDPALAQNYLYADTYQKTAGKLHGFDMARQAMSDVMLHLAPGDNASVAIDGFLKQNFGQGTGVPGYDAEALATFKQQMDRPILAHIENGAKAVMATGLQQLQSVVGDKLRSGQFSAGDVPGLINQFKTLDPANPADAPLRLAQTLRSIATDNPAAAQSLLSELDKPGSSGTAGRSYHEMFPEAYAEIDKTLNEHVVSGMSLNGSIAWANVKTQAQNATKIEDFIDSTNGVLVNAAKVYQQFGGIAHAEQVNGEWATQLKKLEIKGAAINQIDRMANGQLPTVQKTIDEHFLTDYLPAKGLDPYQNPEQVAAIASKLNTVPTDLKDNMSTLLINPNDPAGQKTALRFYDAMKGYYQGDAAVAKSHMSDDAKPIYDAIEQQRATAGNDPGALDGVLQRVNQNIMATRDAHKIEWKQITGDTSEGAAQANATATLTKAITGSGPWSMFHTGATSDTGVAPTIDWSTQNQLLQTLKNSAVLRSQNGKVDLQAVADETMKNMWDSGRAELLPGEGGTTMFHLKDTNDTTPALSPVARNPNTGKPEDTLSTYRGDLQAVSTALPGLIDNPANISVNQSSPIGANGKVPQGADGVYWLNRNGARLQIGLGQTIHMPDQGTPEVQDMGAEPGSGPLKTPLKDVTVPADPREAQAMLSQLLPDNRGLVLVPNDPVDPTSFYVGYRPHFTGVPPAPVTPEQMQAKRGVIAQQLDAVTHPDQDGAATASAPHVGLPVMSADYVFGKQIPRPQTDAQGNITAYPPQTDAKGHIIGPNTYTPVK